MVAEDRSSTQPGLGVGVDSGDSAVDRSVVVYREAHFAKETSGRCCDACTVACRGLTAKVPHATATATASNSISAFPNKKKELNFRIFVWLNIPM